jgi:hypothetical protein
MIDASTSQHLINSKAKPEVCQRCNSNIWVATVNGFKVKVEPNRLNSTEEVILRMAGGRIFQTLRIGNQFELQIRNTWHITKGDPKAIVLAEHDCDRSQKEPIEDFYAAEKTENSEEPSF